MLKKFSHRLLFLPLMGLLGLIAVYCVVEIKKLSNDALIRDIVNDPLPSMIRDIEVSSVRLHSLFEKYEPDLPNKPQDLQPVRAGLDDMGQKVYAISAFLSKDGLADEAHLTEKDYLDRILQTLREVDRNFIIYELKDEKLWSEALHKLQFISEQTLGLRSTVHEARNEMANRLLERIAVDERHRALLLVLVLISGLVLVIALLDTVYHYKTNAERALAAEKCNALFAAALQNTRVGVLIRDMRREGKPAVFVNAAFTSMTGYAFEDIQSETSDFLFGWKTSPEAMAAYRRAIHLQEAAILDLMLYRKDGSPFWSEWHLTPLLGDDGQLAYFVSLLNDTTVIRQTQEDLIQAKATAEHASAVKTTFLAMMSHEIRTPINGILGIFKLLEDTRLDTEQMHLLGIAKTSSGVLHNIINDILDYAKMEAGKIEISPEPFEIRVMLEELTRFAQSLLGEKAVTLDCAVDKAVPEWMVGDVGRLRQILLNLLSNAIKFTESGFVRLRVLPLMQEDVDGKPGYLMRFEVHDTGIGISVENQAKLFQEFSQVDRTFTRRFGGTGLGLAICRRLIGLMNGEINVESQPGKGSRFWFILPMQTTVKPDAFSAPQVPSLQNAASDRHKSSLRILLVEDNETNRLVGRRYVEKLGLAVDEASDGKQAIEMAKSVGYDVILMDVSMPVMDGMMATHHIRALDDYNATVPIIALTAHAMEGDRQLCLAAGMNDYLPKPISMTSLARVLERWLNVSLSDDAAQPSLEAFPDSRPVSVPGPSMPPVIAGAEDAPPELDTAFVSVAPVLDARVLRTMQEELGGAVVGQVTHVFLQDSAKRVEAFVQASNPEDIRDLAHTLKSCSANCGLMRFSLLMAEIERTATDRHGQGRLDALLAMVRSSYLEARQLLEKERDRYNS